MASKKKDVRPVIILACNECKSRNYVTEKNRRNDPNRMELRSIVRIVGRIGCIAKRSSWLVG